MTVAIVADAHLCGPGGPPGPFVQQIRELPGKGCRHLVLLGDIFQAWVGLPRFETPEIRMLVAALEDLRGDGMRVSYVEGNRDFFLDQGRYAGAFDQVARELAFEVEGARHLAVHGDGIDEGDVAYRLWRWVSKSAVSRVLMRRLPARLASRLVGTTERRLGQTNFKHKRRIPRQAIDRYAARRLAEGHDVLLLGHFHEEGRWPVGRGEVRLLDAWFRSRRVELLGGRPADSEPPRAPERSSL